MEAIIDSVKKVGIVKIAIISSVLLGVGWFSMFFADRINKPEQSLLYSDLDPGDAGRIVSKLEEQGIPFKIGASGTEIFVPVDMVAKLRLDMAEAGIPANGSVGYEIFDRGEVFGTSFFVQNLNYLRALEGEIGRSIRTISQIASARVHLVVPKRELFSKDTQEPSASIVLRMKAAGRLDPTKVQAIQYMVSSAVPGLIPERVSIVDDRGNLLSDGSGNAQATVSKHTMEMKENYEQKMEAAIISILERTLGPGKVRAKVSADMNFDRLQEDSEIYDPEGQVTRSTQVVKEDVKSSDKAGSSGGGAAPEGAASEAGGAGGGTAGAGESSNNSNRTESTTNYELSKTVRSLVKESGAVKKISAAIIVDGVTTKAKDGTETYKPRTKEEMAQIEKIVKSSIGFSPERKDTLEVINMPFAKDEDPLFDTPNSSILGMEKHNLIRIVETIILAIVGLLGLLFVAKPLFNRLLDEHSNNQNHGPKQLGIANENNRSGPLLLENNTTNMGSQQQMGQTQMALPQSSQPNNVALIDQQLKSSPIKQVTEIIDKYPEESVSLVRGWINS